MNNDLNLRLKEWNELSYNLFDYSMYLSVYTQGLGQLDCELIALDQFMYENDNKNIMDNIFNGKLGNEHHKKGVKLHTLSNLWVLGVFEIVRIIGGCIKSDIVQETKKMFAEIRTPLAKLQAMGKKDAQIAEPEWYFESKGFSWKISSDEKIYRIDLSNAYLEMLKELPNSKKV